MASMTVEALLASLGGDPFPSYHHAIVEEGGVDPSDASELEDFDSTDLEDLGIPPEHAQAIIASLRRNVKPAANDSNMGNVVDEENSTDDRPSTSNFSEAPSPAIADPSLKGALDTSADNTSEINSGIEAAMEDAVAAMDAASRARSSFDAAMQKSPELKKDISGGLSEAEKAIVEAREARDRFLKQQQEEEAMNDQERAVYELLLAYFAKYAPRAKTEEQLARIAKAGVEKGVEKMYKAMEKRYGVNPLSGERTSSGNVPSKSTSPSPVSSPVATTAPVESVNNTLPKSDSSKQPLPGSAPGQPNFLEWLLRQNPQSREGRFGSIVVRDPLFPRTGSMNDYVAYLWSREAPDLVIRVAKICFQNYELMMRTGGGDMPVDQTPSKPPPPPPPAPITPVSSVKSDPPTRAPPSPSAENTKPKQSDSQANDPNTAIESMLLNLAKQDAASASGVNSTSASNDDISDATIKNSQNRESRLQAARELAGWHYEDNDGNIQGPHTAQEMTVLLDKGTINDKTRIKKGKGYMVLMRDLKKIAQQKGGCLPFAINDTSNLPKAESNEMLRLSKLTDQQRIGIMMKVADGSMTMDEALNEVESQVNNAVEPEEEPQSDNDKLKATPRRNSTWSSIRKSVKKGAESMKKNTSTYLKNVKQQGIRSSMRKKQSPEGSGDSSAPEGLADTNDPEWFYKDNKGELQGPFTGNQLQKWIVKFKDNLLLRKGPEGEFVTLASLKGVNPHDPFGIKSEEKEIQLNDTTNPFKNKSQKIVKASQVCEDSSDTHTSSANNMAKITNIESVATKLPSPKDITSFLDSIGLAKYLDLFKEEDISLLELFECNEGDLKDLGINPGHRKKIIREMNKYDPPK